MILIDKSYIADWRFKNINKNLPQLLLMYSHFTFIVDHLWRAYSQLIGQLNTTVVQIKFNW